LLPICYQIFEGVPDKGVEKYFARMGLWMVFDCEELVGAITGDGVTNLRRKPKLLI